MIHYFYLVEEFFLWERLRPAVAQCRQARSFRPCRELCRELLHRGAGHGEDLLMAQAARDLPYHAATWQGLVGELLVAGARDVPRISLEPTLLVTLLAPGLSQSVRPDLPPIHQALYGARWLDFGVGVYRPEHAGYNDLDDVTRLTAYLQSVNPDLWVGTAAVDPEEVADAQAWWPDLVGMYRNALRQNWVVVCETP